MMPQEIQHVAVVLLASVVALLAGCRVENDGNGAGFTVRDSAGVGIVKNVRPSRSGDRAWRLSPEPVLEIGANASAPEYQFFHVSDAVRLSDGRIVVANAGTAELRYYAPDGSHLRTLGSAGAGPSEFRSLSDLIRAGGDTVIAVDRDLRRISFFRPHGRFLASLRSPPPLGRFADGSLVHSVWAEAERAPPSRMGHVREPRYYVRSWPEREAEDTLVKVPGNDSFREPLVVRGRTRIAYVSPLFARQLHTAVSGMLLWSGSADAFEVAVYASDGRLERLVRWPGEVRPVTARDVDGYRAWALARASSEEARRRTERRVAEMPARDTVPAYSDLRVDAEGNLWVRAFHLFWVDGPIEWWVFDETGRWLSVVSVPKRFRVTEIGTDYVLGEWTDSLDVERIRLYGLEK